MKRNHFRETKYAEFFRWHGGTIAIFLMIALIVVYFVHLIFFEKEKVAVSVLVLTTVSDVRDLEEETLKIIGTQEEGEIRIQSIDTGSIANQAIVTTWIQAQTVDVIIGDREQMEWYAQAGYLKDLGEIEEDGLQDVGEDYLCGLAEYDDQGNTIGIGEEKCFGKYANEIAGVDIDHPVIALAANMTHEENAVKMLFLSGK